MIYYVDYFQKTLESMVSHRLFLTTYEVLFFNVWADRTHRPSFFVLNFDVSYWFRTPGPSSSVDLRPSAQTPALPSSGPSVTSVYSLMHDIGFTAHRPTCLGSIS
jgi:hypothetical protein